MPHMTRAFLTLAAAALLVTPAYAQQPGPSAPPQKPAARAPAKISGAALRAHAARKARAQVESRLKVVQSMWLKAPESNTIPSLRMNLRRMQFEMLTVDLELQKLRQAYALSRKRAAVRDTERVARLTKAFERHLLALKDSDTLSLAALDTKTHDTALRAILGRVQTLPTLPTK